MRREPQKHKWICNRLCVLQQIVSTLSEPENVQRATDYVRQIVSTLCSTLRATDFVRTMQQIVCVATDCVHTLQAEEWTTCNRLCATDCVHTVQQIVSTLSEPESVAEAPLNVQQIVRGSYSLQQTHTPRVWTQSVAQWGHNLAKCSELNAHLNVQPIVCGSESMQQTYTPYEIWGVPLSTLYMSICDMWYLKKATPFIYIYI